MKIIKMTCQNCGSENVGFMVTVDGEYFGETIDCDKNGIVTWSGVPNIKIGGNIKEEIIKNNIEIDEILGSCYGECDDESYLYFEFENGIHEDETEIAFNKAGF